MDQAVDPDSGPDPDGRGALMTSLGEMAVVLRNHVAGCDFLPVQAGKVSLDLLAPSGASICVQLNPGKMLKRYLDGTQIWRQPFTVFYRSKSTKKDGDKAAMIGFLNDLGDWMRAGGPPDFGSGVKVGEISQYGLASVYEQTDAEIAYMATYGFDYEI
jgi:hypothetical protein